MADSTLWWLITGLVVVAELLTGTFYLLMLAIGLAAGALAAHAGLAVTGQIVTAALLGAAATMAWHRWRAKTVAAPVGTDRDINLDIGETVHVESWQADGSASLKYRGAFWTALPAAGTPRTAGAYRIVEVRGNQLIIEKAASSS